MYDATCSVLEKNIVDGFTYSQCGDADNSYKSLTSFEFILILYLMREIIGIINVLCQALRQQSQDIVNVMCLVCFTKALIQNLRENGYDELLKNVTSFCEKHDIEVPNFGVSNVARQVRSRHQKNHITVEHYLRVEIFFVIIDKHLQELNCRFNDHKQSYYF